MLELPVCEPLFSVPPNMVKSVNLDLAAAGIPKQDERGRTVDGVRRPSYTLALELARRRESVVPDFGLDFVCSA